MKTQKNSPKKPADNVYEPGSPYVTVKKPDNPWRTITISSLEEQEESNRIYSANLTHIERMAVLQQLIQIAFGQQLKQPVDKLWNKKIHITKRG